ncbi:G-box-binding factor 1-like isoform X2 [Herrania umbratica]|uniref:G-box-binding factor 1-like isoform X2 n=1 Tax=Herrania umbratica TaxID=108875 RepID=A0A6J1AWN7_9ROSI|nr:G-box-binding factor 1-like isoform X2 [Herrania umbratica]
MGTEDRNSIAKSKPPKQKDSREVRRLAKSHKDKETSAAPVPFPAPHWLNSVQVKDSNRIQYTQDGFSLPNSQLHYLDSMLPISEKVKDIPREKNLDSGRSKEEGTSYRNHTHDSPRSAASGDEASPDGMGDANQDLSATKKQRLNQTKADDYTMVEGSASYVLESALNLAISYSSVGSVSTTAKISDDYDLRKQRRRQLNRESAKRSRLRKQQERERLQARIEVLKVESSALCEELNRVSEECGRLDEENKLIMEEIIPMCGPDDDLAALWAELHA